MSYSATALNLRRYPRHRLRGTIPLAFLCLLPLASCTTLRSTGLPGECRSRQVDRLTFGLSGPQGDIGDAAWQAFVADEIVPRFPAGHTVFETRGQWRGADARVVQERSRVIEVVHDGGSAQVQRVREVVDGYKRRFQQDAVLVTRSSVIACF